MSRFAENACQRYMATAIVVVIEAISEIILTSYLIITCIQA